MKILVTVTKELDDLWLTDMAEGMTDADIVDLVKEDLIAFVDGASFTVERLEEPDVDAATGTADDEIPGATVQAIDKHLKNSSPGKKK